MSTVRTQSRTTEFRQSYAGAFGAYVAKPDERTLRAAYELGREAVSRDLGVVDVAAVHHEVLRSALAAGLRRVDEVVAAAGDFLVESLSSFEMVQRGYRHVRERALLEQRHAAMLRQLSALLSDASLAAGAADSLAEVLQLVAEQARELTGATSCVARARIGANVRWATARAHEQGFAAPSDPASGSNRLRAPLVSLAGAEIGMLEIVKHEGRFSELDEAILVHVGQMAAATIERAQRSLP